MKYRVTQLDVDYFEVEYLLEEKILGFIPNATWVRLDVYGSLESCKKRIERHKNAQQYPKVVYSEES